MNIARFFSYTREVERQRDEMVRRLADELARNQELSDTLVFHRMPRRLMDTDLPQNTNPQLPEIPERPQNMDDAEYREWLDRYTQADPLTRADMLAEIEEE